MKGWKILNREVLLNVAGNNLVIWAFVKLCLAYKYVGFLV